jgi:ribosomal protein S18 acetylase RimI-like enzyme
MVSQSVRIRRAEPADSAAIAKAHRRQIPWGLLSQFGEEFVAAFYDTLVRSAVGFGLVAERDERLVGFTMGVVSWRRFYAEFLRRHPSMAVRAALSSVRGGRWRRLVDTSRYAASGVLPPAELISIAVEPEVRGTGTAAELVRGLLDEFAGRKVNAVRVTAGGSNVHAQRLYERMGFSLRSRMEIHKGEKAAVYVITLEAV